MPALDLGGLPLWALLLVVAGVAGLVWVAGVRLTRHAGILPALESAHALAAVGRMMPELPADSAVVVNLSGRGDKDLDIVAGFDR